MAGLQSATFQAPSKGLDNNSAPSYVEATNAPLVQNFLPARKGRLPVRGSASGTSTNAVVANRTYVYPWTFDNMVLLPTSGTNVGTWVNLSTMGSGSIGTATSLTVKEIGRSHSRLGIYTYGTGFDAAIAAPTFETLLRWDGSTGATPLVSYVNAPRGIRAVTTYLNRLFVIATNTTTDIMANTLLWSDDGGPTADTAAMWQDDVTGLASKIEFPNDGEACVGLARIGRNLLILRSRSLWMLSGTSPDTFAIRRVASVGCGGINSIVEYNDGVFFASNPDGGLYFFDGATAQRVSDPINGSVTRLSFSSVTRIDDEYLIASPVLTPGSSSASDRVYMYHVPTSSWVEFTSPAMTGKLTWFGRTTTNAFGVEGSGTALRAWNITLIGQPIGNINSPGTDSIGAAATLIPARVTTRALKLGSPELRSQLSKLLADYDLSTSGSGAVTSGTAWSVTATDDVGNTLFTTTLPASDNPGRLRAVIDAFGEVSGSMQLDVQLVQPGAARSLSTAELQDLTVVYQQTRQRTG